MDAIEVLMSEHRLIERVIGALQKFARAASPGTPPAGLQPFVTFIREFADAAHHEKEEKILFTAMADAGFPVQAGPIAVMLQDHETGRAYARTLAELSASSSWVADDCGLVVTAAEGYAELLLTHIQKEDRILYPMARQHLGAGMRDVDAACAEADARRIASGQDAKLRALADQILQARAA